MRTTARPRAHSSRSHRAVRTSTVRRTRSIGRIRRRRRSRPTNRVAERGCHRAPRWRARIGIASFALGSLLALVLGVGMTSGTLGGHELQTALSGLGRHGTGSEDTLMRLNPRAPMDTADGTIAPMVTPSAAPSHTSALTLSPSAARTGTATASRSQTRRPAAAPSSAAASSAAAPARPRSTAPTADSPAQQVLDQLNQARADAGLPALTMTSGLLASSKLHTQLMADGCGMQHQCSGEADLGSRISAQGVSWHSAGENIGYGGPVEDTNTAIAGMAERLTSSMLAETPPDDGHRRNILNSGFHHVGITVYRDAQGLVWMTQDFSD